MPTRAKERRTFTLREQHVTINEVTRINLIIMTKEQLAYFGGFMDADGTITIKRFNRYDRWHYCGVLSCTQVDKPKGAKVIEEMQTLFGGSLSRYTQKPKNSKWLDTIQWQITGRPAEDCVKMLYPYLKIKYRQAELLIEFIDTIALKKERRMYRLTDEVMQKRKQLFAEMRSHNVKGKLRFTLND